MNKQKVLTKALNNYGMGSRLIDTLTKDPKEELERELKQELELKRKYIDLYTEEYYKVLSDECMKNNNNGHGHIDGYISLSEHVDEGCHYYKGKLEKKLPISDPKEIQRQGRYESYGYCPGGEWNYHFNSDQWFHSPYKNYRNQASRSTVYKAYALPYNDFEFVNGLVESLNNKLFEEGLKNFSIIPVELDNVIIHRHIKKTLFGALRLDKKSTFTSTIEGKCTVLKFDINW